MTFTAYPDPQNESFAANGLEWSSNPELSNLQVTVYADRVEARYMIPEGASGLVEVKAVSGSSEGKAFVMVVEGEQWVITPQPAVVGQDDVLAMSATQDGVTGMGAWMTKADFDLLWEIFSMTLAQSDTVTARQMLSTMFDEPNLTPPPLVAQLVTEGLPLLRVTVTDWDWMAAVEELIINGQTVDTSGWYPEDWEELLTQPHVQEMVLVLTENQEVVVERTIRAVMSDTGAEWHGVNTGSVDVVFFPMQEIAEVFASVSSTLTHHNESGIRGSCDSYPEWTLAEATLWVVNVGRVVAKDWQTGQTAESMRDTETGIVTEGTLSSQLGAQITLQSFIYPPNAPTWPNNKPRWVLTRQPIGSTGAFSEEHGAAMTTFRGYGVSGLFRLVATHHGESTFAEPEEIAINNLQDQKVSPAIVLEDSVGVITEFDTHAGQPQRGGALIGIVRFTEDCSHTAKIRIRVISDDPQSGGQASAPAEEREAIWTTNDTVIFSLMLERESANIKDVKVVVERRKADLTWEIVATEPFSIVRFKLSEWLVKSNTGDEQTCYVYFWDDKAVRGPKRLFFGCPPGDVNLNEIDREIPRDNDVPRKIYAGGMGGKVIPYGPRDILAKFRVGFVQNLIPLGPDGNKFSTKIVAEYAGGKKMGFISSDQLNDSGKKDKRQRTTLVNETPVGAPLEPISLMFADSPRSPIDRLDGKMPDTVIFQSHFTTWLSILNKDSKRVKHLVHMEWGLNWKIEKVNRQSNDYHFRNYRVIPTDPPADKPLTLGTGPSLPFFGQGATDILDVLQFREIP